MTEVLLAGDLTARDPGDDALLTAFSGGLPGRELTLLSAGAPVRPQRGRHRVVWLGDRRGLLSALRNCRVLVLGDGALRGSKTRGDRDRARQTLRIALVAKALGRRVALVGVGAGQLDRGTDRARANALVRLSDLLVLRDPGTAEVLAAAGAPGPFRVAADPAWCALKPLPAPALERHGVLVILDSDALPADGPARLATALDLLAEHGLAVQLAPWRVSRYGADDLELARSVAARMAADGCVLLPAAGFDEARDEAGRAQVVLALRLHALVVAAGAATPVVALSDDPETVRLAGRLRQPTVSANATPEVIADAVLSAVGGTPADQEAVRSEQSAAQQAFRLLRLLLDAERSEEDHELAALPLMPESPTTPGSAAAGSPR